MGAAKTAISDQRGPMKVGNVIRDFTIVGSNYTLRVEVNGEDLQAVANALWDESRQAARAAAQIEAGLRPYPWDKSVASEAGG